MKAKPLVKISAAPGVTVKPLSAFETLPKTLKARLAFPKDFKTAVIVDNAGTPRYFAFDTYSLWDFVCAIDEEFEARVSDEAYVFHNPVGWLVDAIEQHLPVNPKVVSKLKKGREEAKRLGVVSFERITQELGLT